MQVLPDQLTQNRAMLLRVLGWIAAAVSALVLLSAIAARLDRPTMDFHSYFTAAHLVTEGQPVASFYDDEWFKREASRFAPLEEIYGPNVPTTALFFAPVAIFQSEVDAHLAWTAASFVLLILFVEGLVRIASASAARPYWYVAAFLAQPVKENLIQGQAYIVVALGLVLFLKWWKDNREAQAGVMLAGLFAYKSIGFVLWPLALVTGRWRVVAWGVATLAMIVALTWPVIGLDGWLAYLNSMQQVMTTRPICATAYQSVQGFFQHLFSAGGNWGTPAWALPVETVRWTCSVLVLGFTLITLYLAARHRDDELAIGASILLCLFLVPLSQAHTYVLAFVPIAQLFRRLGGTSVRWEVAALWFGAAAIMVPTPYRSLRLVDGWASVIAYPKLYGALVLWGLCIMLMAQKKRSAALSDRVQAGGEWWARQGSNL